MSINFNHLGDLNSYYKVNENNKIIIYKNFQEVLNSESKSEVDLASVLSVLAKNYILGDKTLLKGIYRSPWMAALVNQQWQYHELPAHQHDGHSIEYIGKQLFTLLCDEILSYIGKKKRIGILLSGGMDSRMVAGVLDYLIKSKRIEIDYVTAYTWGNHDSRDVVYSQKIANRLGWQWKHYVVDADKLWRNIEIAAARGCEYSGIHLHAMPDIALDAEHEVDVILAGSYGDSVGRAEYSGKHASKLSPIQEGLGKFAYLLNIKNVSAHIKELNQEVDRYHQLFPRESKAAQYEMDRQLHYMRKMLNPCMEVINEKVPLFQAFTDPKVFGFMWSLDFSLRNNEVYKELPKFFKTDLCDIPWARTGKPYGDMEAQEDQWKKKHHSYEQYLQNDLYPRFIKVVDKHNSALINTKQLKSLIHLVHKFQGYNFDFLEAITWCIAFLKLEEKEKLQFNRADQNRKLNFSAVYKDYFFLYFGRKVKRLLR
jgi:hypothetical protein